MNKRRHQRIEVDNLVAEVSDGVGFCSGTVCDVSRYGIKVDCLPHKFRKLADRLSIMISVNGILSFKKMRGIPRWMTGNIHGKKMGIQIIDATSSWTVFVKNFEPEDVADTNGNGFE